MVEDGVSWKGVWTVFQLQLGNWSRSKRAKLTFCVYNNASSIVLHNVKLDGRPLTLTHDTDKNVYFGQSIKSGLGLGVMCGWGLGRS